MLAAAATHLRRGETKEAVTPLVLAAIAGFVAFMPERPLHLNGALCRRGSGAPLSGE